jgi:hypothetical protein
MVETTIIRIKRKRQENALEALLVSNIDKKIKKCQPMVFKLMESVNYTPENSPTIKVKII